MPYAARIASAPTYASRHHASRSGTAYPDVDDRVATRWCCCHAVTGGGVVASAAPRPTPSSATMARPAPRPAPRHYLGLAQRAGAVVQVERGVDASARAMSSGERSTSPASGRVRGCAGVRWAGPRAARALGLHRPGTPIDRHRARLSPRCPLGDHLSIPASTIRTTGSGASRPPAIEYAPRPGFQRHRETDLDVCLVRMSTPTTLPNSGRTSSKSTRPAAVTSVLRRTMPCAMSSAVTVADGGRTQTGGMHQLSRLAPRCVEIGNQRGTYCAGAGPCCMPRRWSHTPFCQTRHAPPSSLPSTPYAGRLIRQNGPALRSLKP